MLALFSDKQTDCRPATSFARQGLRILLADRPALSTLKTKGCSHNAHYCHMPITRDTWENFFQGAFAEHHVGSLFYFYGYEVQKLSPDIGIDFLVTNIARSRFNGENSVHIEIQVKSALLDRSGAFVAMHGSEVDFLSQGDNRYCVCILLSNLRGSPDPESFERGDDPDASRAVDRDIMRDMENRAAAEARSLRRKGALSIYDFSTADVTLFWLHTSHLRRLRDEHLLKKMRDDWWGIEVSVEDDVVSVGGIPLIRELQELEFIVRRCKAGTRIRQGHMSMDDY